MFQKMKPDMRDEEKNVTLIKPEKKTQIAVYNAKNKTWQRGNVRE